MNIETITSQIDDFILKLKPETRARVIRVIELLEKYENKLGMPFSKSIGNALFELRIIGKEHIRIVYCFHKNTIFLLTVFNKKTSKIPRSEIELAKKRRKMLV